MLFNINTDYNSPAPEKSTMIHVWQIALSFDSSEMLESFSEWRVREAVEKVLHKLSEQVTEELNKFSEQYSQDTVRGKLSTNCVLTQKWNCSDRERVWRLPEQGYLCVTISPDKVMNLWTHSNERMLDPDNNPGDYAFQQEWRRTTGMYTEAYPTVRRRTAMQIMRDNLNVHELVHGFMAKVKEHVLGEIGDGVKPDDRFRF